MPYVKTEWRDHVLDGNGNVVQQGTPVNADNLNKIEEGISNAVTKDGADTITYGLFFKNPTATHKNGGAILTGDGNNGKGVTVLRSMDDIEKPDEHRVELHLNGGEVEGDENLEFFKIVKNQVTKRVLLHSGNYTRYAVPKTRTVNGHALSSDINLTYSDVGAAPTSHGNHVPTTETANNAKFLRNDNTWQTVTPANIGAAPSSHTHAASQVTEGTLGGKVCANATSAADVTQAQVRNIYAGTTDMTAGSSALATGTIYFVYE